MLHDRVASDLRGIRDELAKVGTAAHRKETPFFNCLSRLEALADVLEGNFDLEGGADPAPKPVPKPARRRTGNVIYDIRLCHANKG